MRSPWLLILALTTAAARAEAPFAVGPDALQALRAAAPAAAPEGHSLRVLTYNVHGTTPLSAYDALTAGFAASLNRFHEIARRLREQRARGTAPHIVAIQEGFNPWSAKAALEAGYPYVQAGASTKFGRPARSGLYILSEFPILAADTIDYQQCTGFDCLANKGALHVRVYAPEFKQAFDVYTTHMNADEPPVKPEETRKARKAQIGEFADFIRRTRDPGLPAILAADFNFRPPHDDYALFEREVGAQDTAEDCFLSRGCSGDDPLKDWRGPVDHQFHIGGAKGWLQPTFVAQTFKEIFGGEPLSDHKGLEAHYLLRRLPAP